MKLLAELLTQVIWPGQPAAESRDTVEPIFDQTGKVLGWFFNHVVYDRERRYRALVRSGAVYAYTGRYLGYLDQELFRDRSGQVVAYLSGAQGAPTPPLYEAPPEASSLPTPPMLPLPSMPPAPPTPRLGWSLVRWEGFLRGQVMAKRLILLHGRRDPAQAPAPARRASARAGQTPPLED
jgi:hypothetical protein